MNPLLNDIEAFIETHEMSPTQFGIAALRDKHFIRDLKNGRDIRLSTEQRVRRFMLTYRAAA
jgi:hypothetical protein